MTWDPKSTKRPYRAPSFEVLDSNGAKTQLETKGDPEDANVPKVLSLIEAQRKQEKTGHVVRPSAPGQDDHRNKINRSDPRNTRRSDGILKSTTMRRPSSRILKPH
jgi:hypothetical protein